MFRTYDALGKIALNAARLGGAAMLLISVLVTIDVILRKFFTTSLQNVPEISGYIFIVAIAWSLGHALVQRAHIRIDTVYGRLPPRMAAVADILGMMSMLAVSAIIAWFAADVLHGSWAANSRSLSTLGAPLWVPQLAWVGGLVFFALVVAMALTCALIAFARNDIRQVRRIAGLPSIDETIEDELRDTAERPSAADRIS